MSNICPPVGDTYSTPKRGASDNPSAPPVITMENNAVDYAIENFQETTATTGPQIPANNTLLSAKTPLLPRDFSVAVGKTHYKNKDFEQAKNELEGFLQMSPKHLRALHLMGKTKWKLNDHDGALQCFNEGIEIGDATQLQFFYIIRAYFYRDLQRYDDALDDANFVRNGYDKGQAMAEKCIESIGKIDVRLAFSNRWCVLTTHFCYCFCMQR